MNKVTEVGTYVIYFSKALDKRVFISCVSLNTKSLDVLE